MSSIPIESDSEDEISNDISELKKIIANQENEIDSLFNSVIQLELDNEESFKKRAYYEDEYKKLNKKLERLFEVLVED